MVPAHARALLRSAPQGATAYVDADLRDTAGILRNAAGTLDLSQPTAVMLVAVLQYIQSQERQRPGPLPCGAASGGRAS